MSGLHLHRAERADVLVDGLTEVLRAPPADPFVPEIVAVPARGVERWLTQRLSHHLGARAGDGVCANVDFPPPTALVASAVAAGSGVDADDDLWAPHRLVWSLLGLLDECAGEPWCAVLTRHLRGAGGSTSRRMVAAQHLTGLFTAYGEQRPAMLRGWAAGTDTAGTHTDGTVAADLSWQPQLWRRLRARLGVDSPAERIDAAGAALRDDPQLVDLPQRLSIFGPTRLTRGQVAIVAALAAHRDVHLWLPHPSAVEWARVAPLAATTGQPKRRSAHAGGAPGSNRLLASLGRDAREMQLLLASTAGAAVDTDQHHRLPHHEPTTLLGRLQHNLRTDAAPPGRPLRDGADGRPLLATADRSLQVHACHGRARQVEVLREVLLGLLAADLSLEPRDVLVMCPDIEAYAPLVSATFGLAPTDDPARPLSGHPGHGLRVRLADRSLRQTNPLLATLARLLDLADSRLTASQVIDLIAQPPVRRRFGLDDDDLERVREWVRVAGVRWGLDAAHRAPFRMHGVAQNTWAAGLDRLLLGVSMAEDPGEPRWVGLALPLDDVDSGDVDLAGRFAELVDRLEEVLGGLTGTRSLADWLDALLGAVDALTAVGAADEWQLAQVRRELADVADAAGERAGSTSLALGDVRALLADRLAGRPTRANFRTGNLTMCSMVPMRSVPHRVICLLGLDDGVFPRTTGVDGDDVLARDPLVGERDRRSEDRQLLLDAVLAAQEHLVVVYSGADERTNSPRPPAVPLGEILDVVDATVRTDDQRPAREQVVVRHPLQPFDARNFEPGALGGGGAFSFDRAALAGAVAASGPRQPAGPFLTGPLPTPEPETDRTLDLDTLIRFLEHPVRGFLRQRLGVTAADEADELNDSLHAELSGLDKWAVGDRWLRARLAGADEQTCTQAEWRRGELPPGALGRRLLGEVQAISEPIFAAGAADRVGPARSVDVAVSLPGGRVLAGTVSGVYGDVVARTVYSTLAGKHRLRAWVQLLALAAGDTASHPGSSWRAATVGRAGAKARRSVLSAPPGEDATQLLAWLVDLHAWGHCEPLPLPLGASHAYAERRELGESEPDALDAAAKVWADREADDAYHRIVWGEAYPFLALLAAPAIPAEQVSPVGPAETSRFAVLARQLWIPLLAAEETS